MSSKTLLIENARVNGLTGFVELAIADARPLNLTLGLY